VYVQELLANKRSSYQTEKRYLHKHGHPVWILLSISLLRDDAQQPVYFIVQIQDISKRKATEAALLDSERRFRAIFDQTFQFMGLLEPDGTLLEANETALQFAGVASADVVGRPFWDAYWWTILPETQDQLKQAVAQAASGTFVRYEVDVRGSGDAIVAINFSIKPVLNDDGEVLLLIPEGRDITERKQAEQRVVASLREKEVLLQEIHHRVKNNLQVISSLLKFQTDKITDQQMLDLFNESQHRVRSMALVHEKLYQTHDFAQIDFAEYLKSLAAYLYRSYAGSTTNVKLETQSEPVLVKIEQAVPLGLIVNELISNALKYAFPGGSSGLIQLNLQRAADKQLCLTIRDDGIGLPSVVDIHQPDSLGLWLVSMLAKQVHGKIELDRSQGTTFVLTVQGV